MKYSTHENITARFWTWLLALFFNDCELNHFFPTIRILYCGTCMERVRQEVRARVRVAFFGMFSAIWAVWWMFDSWFDLKKKTRMHEQNMVDFKTCKRCWRYQNDQNHAFEILNYKIYYFQHWKRKINTISIFFKHSFSEIISFYNY